jgi:hypothetical protein
MRTASQLWLFFLPLILPVSSICAESDQQLVAKIAGVWVNREIVYYSDVEVQTTYRADGTMSRLAKFSDDRRRYAFSVQGRWKVEKGELVSVCQSFSGQTERSVDDIIAVTEKMLLLRAEDGTLKHYIRSPLGVPSSEFRVPGSDGVLYSQRSSTWTRFRSSLGRAKIVFFAAAKTG